ncbi:MAG: transporter [Gemmataceae bacterium]|nr:transporter [Gemmataceae bacterium]
MKMRISLVAAGVLIVVGQAPGQTPAALPSEIPAILTPAREQVGERPESPEPRERDEIETDRDSFTPSTKTVGRRRLVIESAYTFLENRGRAETHSFPEFLARFGLTERIELRLGWNYEVGGAANTVSGGGEGGEGFGSGLERASNLNLGVKARITEQNRWVPESSVILAGLIPTGGPESTPLFAGTYVFGWELPNRWKFDAAMRYGTDIGEGDHFSDWAPSVVIKVPIGEKWAAHAEYFGTFTSGKEHDDVRHYFSPGVHYLITPDLEVGTRLGWGLNDQSSRFFCNVGLGCRF